MSGAVGTGGSHLELLLRLDRTRLSSILSRPALTLVAAVVIPIVAVVSALWLLGRVAAPGVEGLYRGITLGLLISAAVAFMAYGLLFGGSDDSFLRRLGIHPRALFLERCLRLATAGAGVAVALLIPAVASGGSVGGPLLVGLGAALASVTGAAVSLAWAARATITGQAKVMSVGISQFDPDLGRAAPLVYAPLPPLLAGAAVGAALGSASAWGLMSGLLALGLGALAVPLAARTFDSAAPRFLPHVREISYVPPPESGETFRVGRGLSALLPRRAAAVWVRDATVAGRRFAWAARVTWPVAIVSIVALARWGTAPATQVWVIVAIGLTLFVQGAAIVALGRLERGGTRWIDRSAGLRRWERFLGRWTWGWGLSLWLLVPVALAWYWWSGQRGEWLWPLAGGITSAVAATASLLQAERR